MLGCCEVRVTRQLISNYPHNKISVTMGAAGDVFDFAKIVDASTEYSDAHRGLLKIMIDRGSLTEKAFYAHFVRCFATQHYLDEIDYDRNELNLKGVTKESVADLRKNLIDIMNAKTQHIGLRLMNAHDEVKNKKMIVLVSERHFSPAMAGASPFDSHNELFLVISWLEEMLKRDNDGYMCINDALRSAKNLPVPMKMEKAQQLIDQLFKDDWIRREAGEMLTLTTRALTELGPILRSRFHCATCCLCSNVTIRKASMLSCEECESLMHVSCWNNLAANANTEKVRCPGYNCKAMLSKEEMEESAKQIEEARVYGNRRRRLSSDSEPGPSKKKNGRGRKATKRTSNSESEPEEEEEVDMMMGNDDDEMEEDDDEIFVRQTQKKSRKQPRHSQGSSQKQPRKRSKDDEEDEDMMMEED